SCEGRSPRRPPPPNAWLITTRELEVVAQSAMVTGTVVPLLRDWASVTVTGMLNAPRGRPAGTVAAKVKTLSPATASPLVPSSKSCWVEERPMLERLAVTARPVESGSTPLSTPAVKTSGPPLEQAAVGAREAVTAGGTERSGVPVRVTRSNRQLPDALLYCPP